MRILVTGAAGFIGSNFVRYWLERHPDDHVVAYDLLTYAGNRESLHARTVPFVAGRHRRRRARRADAARRGDRGGRQLRRRVAQLARGRRPRPLLPHERDRHADDARGRPPHRGRSGFHHVSTCEVYGDLPLDSDEVFTEETPYRPRTPYNASKAGADHAVRAYFETYELPVTITNCSNNYGPYQFPEKVIPLFATNALDDKPLPLYASTANKREWLHVLDHCSAIELVLERGRLGETYNVGSGVEKSIEEIADAVLEHTGKPESLKTIVPDRPGHDRRYLLDSTKLREELGWRDEIAWEDGIAQTVAWYADNREWWEPLRDRAPVDEAAWR